MRRAFPWVTVLAMGWIAWQAAVPAAAQERKERIEGRYRIQLMNDTFVEGDVKQLDDGAYEVKTKQGVIVTVRPNQVKSIISLDEAVGTAPEETVANSKRRIVTPRRTIGDDEIEVILSGVTAEYDASIRGSTRDDLMAELPTDEESLADMKRLMGPDAKVLLKPHFMLVYTSSDESARALASRLEAVWRHNVDFMDRLELPARQPDSKIEIFYFGTWKEFDAYNINQGSSMPLGVAGYYSPEWNRSHFFDFNKSFFTQRWDEIIDNPDADWRDKQKARNEKRRFAEHQNLEVIQHETGHHIHFNIGLFPRDSFGGQGVPVWLVEGTTMMFEVPPTDAGASIGVLNHYRLYMLRKTWGPHPLSAAEWKLFLIDNGLWRGFHSYQLGWSMVYYLYKKHRDGYAEYLRRVFGREEGFEMSMTDREKEFEDIFGRVDEKWIKEFYAFLDTLYVKKSALPPDEQESFDETVNDTARKVRGKDSEGEKDEEGGGQRRGRGRGR